MLKSPAPLLTKIKEEVQVFTSVESILVVDNKSFIVKDGIVVGILKELTEDTIETLHKYKIPYTQ